MKKNIIYILTVIFLLCSNISRASSLEKTLIIVVDNVSFSDLEKIERDDYGLGLMNLKVRNSNDKKDILTSINVGRKIQFEKIKSENIRLNYMGDTFKNQISYLGEENSDLKYLVMDQAGNYNYIDLAPSPENIGLGFKENQILAVEVNIQDKDSISLINQILRDNSKNKVYLISTSLDKTSNLIFNRGLGPVMVSGHKGVLTSDSTRRLGLITMEDVNTDLQEKNGIEKNKLNIGKTIQSKDIKNPYEFVNEFNNETNQLIFVSYILHGVTYLSIALLCLSLHLNKYLNYAIAFFIFNINNIFLSLILSLTVYTNNLMFYLLIIIFMNSFFTRSVLRNIDGYKIVVSLTYLIIILSSFFNFDIIYNSYVGFNNLMYGVRYYGFNNAMAGVLLGLSIIIMDSIYKSDLGKLKKNIIILVVNFLNIFVLSAKYGANTGGFITALTLLGLSSYAYIFSKKISLKNILYTLVLAMILLVLNLYLDSLDNSKSHALQFILRIKENGIGEFFYIVLFKLKELIKFTIMPPFSIVIVAEFLIIKKLSDNIDLSFKVLLATSILGFLINDTGNVLLIYMLNYGILLLIHKEVKNKGLNIDLSRGGKNVKKIY